MFARLKHWWTHVHEWETLGRMEIHTGPPYIFGVDTDYERWPISGYQYTLKCKTCGTITTKSV